MTPVKINIYISYTKQDEAVLRDLQHWLHPMRDEVNIWFVNPPEELPLMPMPWNFLFFWYNPPDTMDLYRKVLVAQLQRAHIYIFLTNQRSITDQRIGQEIDFAVNRRIERAHELNPLIFPIITSPCQWRRHSRLSGYKPLGSFKSLAETKVKGEAYLEITEQLTKAIRSLQTPLNEAKYTLAKMSPEARKVLKPNPYVDDDPAAVTYKAPSVAYPPVWLGWALVLLILVSVASAIYKANPRIIRKRGDNAERTEARPEEYRRENPLMPPPQ
jgi:hypothetical protein